MQSRETDTAANGFLERVRMIGRTAGSVKKLTGFKKGHHTVPDAVTSATTAFLAKLCAAELAGEAETFFQQTRAAMGYKRQELSLAVETPSALLRARDFTMEWTYALNPDSPDEYILSRTLHGLCDDTPEKFAAAETLFDRMFEEIEFALTRPVQIEAVIDAVETVEDSTITVDYPSDYRHCTLRVANIPAEVSFHGATLAMRFARPGSPRELIEAFIAFRHAFSLHKSTPLAALLA